MAKYKWKSAGDWLDDALKTKGDEWVEQAAFRMAQELDSDQIQELFEDAMDNDGYFTLLYSMQFVPNNKNLAPETAEDWAIDSEDYEQGIDELVDELITLQIYPAGTVGTVLVYDGQHCVHTRYYVEL
jgi:hypothetical protein